MPYSFTPLQAVLDYIFLYPLVMTYAWLCGALLYFVKWERNQSLAPPQLKQYPPLSILLPCHNESANIRETIGWLLKLRYPEFEIIAINDGSQDDTGIILDELARAHARLRVIHLASNQGKAMGLRMGALLSQNEYLVCIDGDAILEADACTWMMWHFLSQPKVGAVTGNPRIRNRSTLLGKIQVGEFSCIVGTIKRAQRIYGRLFSVSGVICAFRKSALHRVGYWSLDMITEDVDITWKLQRDGWDVRFEPHAKCWILMPETLKGLWKQRLRWAQGGAEVAIRNLDILWHPRQVHMWPVLAEFVLSVLWVYLFVGTSIGISVAVLLQADIPSSLLWEYAGGQNAAAVTVLTCFAQFGVGLFLDRRYEPGLWKSLFWIVWYPFYYWVIIVCATFVGLPKALLKRRGQRALWTSSDRGFRA